MIQRFREDPCFRRATRSQVLSIISVILIGFLLAPSNALAKTIFDDDWTPPKADKPPETPPAQPPATPETPTNQVPVPPPATAPAIPQRRAIPLAADQAKSRKLFREFYAADLANRSAAARRALAAKLLDQAGAVSDAPSDQFVLLVGAGQAAREGADLPLVSKAADTLADAYEVDGLHLKSEAALQMTLRTDSPAATTENCRTGLELVDRLAAAEEYADALRLLKSLQAAAPDAELRSQIQSRTKEIDALKTEADRIALFTQKLKTAPDDPVANLAVGQHLCFDKNDWAHGLPLLAKGSDATAKNLATLELKNSTDADGQVAVADGWWGYADTQQASPKMAIQSHARVYYQKALPDLKGLVKLKALSRLPESQSAQPPIAIKAPTAPVRNNDFDEMLPDMEGGTRDADGIVSVTMGNVHTANKFKTPVAFRVVAKTSVNNLRLSFGPMKVIFDWAIDMNELRIDGAPPGVHHKKGAGYIAPDTWATIDLIVEPETMTILVDGHERYHTQANFSDISGPFAVFCPVEGPVVSVKSVQIKKMRTDTEAGSGTVGVLPNQPATASPPVPSTISSLERMLNDPTHWKIKTGKWNLSPGKIHGEGDSEIDFDTPLPSSITFSVHMNVLKGMRPRIILKEPKISFANEGYTRNLFPHGPKDVTGDKFVYQNNEPHLVTFNIAGDHFEISIDEKPTFGGTCKAAKSIHLSLRAGDSWSPGAVDYYDFKVKGQPSGEVGK